jgi:hypothetical protein
MQHTHYVHVIFWVIWPLEAEARLNNT